MKPRTLEDIAYGLGIAKEVSRLDIGQTPLDLGLVGEVGQQIDEPLVGQPKDGLVVPEGVVGIDADRGDCGHGLFLADWLCAMESG
jgi:hypothetical protein